MEPIGRNKKGQFIENGHKTRTHFPVVNTQYGNFTVISTESKLTKDKKVMFYVKCTCGNEQWIRAYFLTSGRQTSCKVCSQRDAVEKFDSRRNFFTGHKGIGNLNKITYNYIKNCAKRRNIFWSEDLTIEHIWSLFEEQNKKCKLSGLPIDFTTERKNSNVDFSKMTASLDRINSDLGYTKDNIQWVHKDINRMKWCFNQEHFIKLCGLVFNKSISSQVEGTPSKGSETSGEIELS